MIDTTGKKEASNHLVKESIKQTEAAKRYDELNKPMMLAKNQQLVAQKLTEFHDSIVEKYGSSQVPTPDVKAVYKQCGGQESSIT